MTNFSGCSVVYNVFVCVQILELRNIKVVLDLQSCINLKYHAMYTVDNHICVCMLYVAVHELSWYVHN